MSTLPNRSFLEDTWLYLCRISSFEKEDWSVYCAWVGLMIGLLAGVCGFVFTGFLKGVVYPAYVWNVPFGTFVFIVAIAFDTIGHRTVYKEALKTGESLVHHITIAAGISSVLLLCMAYYHHDLLMIPALCLVGMSIFYSVIDEAMHWFRYSAGNSDRIEMWSHFFIFVGHTIMIVSWSYWFLQGYPGVAETLTAMGR